MILLGALLWYTVSTTDKPQRPAALQSESDTHSATSDKTAPGEDDQSIWSRLAGSLESVNLANQLDASKLTDSLLDLLAPEWAKNIPIYIRKLQREFALGPGTLAHEVWQEAQDPSIHPETQYEATVRVSNHLCDEEKTFLSRRKQVVAAALGKYLGIAPNDIHPDDVPIIAMCGSGGGLRALVAGAGSFMATTEDGLFDCTTYLSGVSGSCWLQTLYFSSVTERNLGRTIDHLKARLGVHIASPQGCFSLLTSAPTNKYLLSGTIEKLMGVPGADVGLVDAYGMLLAARLLVPKGELGVDEKDFKLSSQGEHIKYGQNPMPIYTAVRHEIPPLFDAATEASQPTVEAAEEVAKNESWFQWFEMTPYEFFCEEFGAGVPTWAMGRKFEAGRDKPNEDGIRLPEIRTPFLLGIWGSAFCATLSHYYREIRPVIKSISGLGYIDDLIWGHNDDLSKLHPIEPATIPNFIYGMDDQLPHTVPPHLKSQEFIQLMDAGMSNNLPIYPLLRPGRDVDIVVTFDASADIKTDNWLSVVEGYALQRGIKGWPVGIGWPKTTAPAATMAKQLDQAQADSGVEAEQKLTSAKIDQAVRHAQDPFPHPAAQPNPPKSDEKKTQIEKADKAAKELGYCTVWVGRTQERQSDPPPEPLDDTTSWRLMEPDAGITVVYLPFLANAKVPGVDPAASDYMSTWNFVYTPQQVDDAVALARANYAEGRAQIMATVKAVYERKKKRRVEREERERRERRRRRVRRGVDGRLGEGDHFS